MIHPEDITQDPRPPICKGRKVGYSFFITDRRTTDDNSSYTFFRSSAKNIFDLRFRQHAHTTFVIRFLARHRPRVVSPTASRSSTRTSPAEPRLELVAEAVAVIEFFRSSVPRRNDHTGIHVPVCLRAVRFYNQVPPVQYYYLLCRHVIGCIAYCSDTTCLQPGGQRV